MLHNFTEKKLRGPILDDYYSQYGYAPIQGNYSAYLQSAFTTSTTLSQMGTIPTGTESIQLDAEEQFSSFTVTVGGQTINMIPLQALSGYTVYGGNVSTWAGQDVTVSITELPPPEGSEPSPSTLLFDNISFSQTAVPEPSIVALAAIGGLLFGVRKWFARRGNL